MIIGIGADICSVARIQRMADRYGGRFLDRIFTQEEQQSARCEANQAERLAARFAAKEAMMKALGTGWACGVRFLDIQVNSAPGGRPSVSLAGAAAAWARRLGVERIHISLSHERDQAVAFVVLEGGQGTAGQGTQG